MSIWALGTLTKVILTSSLGERGSSQLAKGESNLEILHPLDDKEYREIYKGQEVYEQYINVVPNICTAQAMSCTITKLFYLTSMACHPLVVYSDLTGMGVADATKNNGHV
jgi:hypothetical protein